MTEENEHGNTENISELCRKIIRTKKRGTEHRTKQLSSLRWFEMARIGVRNLAVVGLLVVAMFAMVTNAEARLAPCYDDWCDRTAVSNEAYMALSGRNYYYGPFSQYELGMWNYLASDVSATKKVVGGSLAVQECMQGGRQTEYTEVIMTMVTGMIAPLERK